MNRRYFIEVAYKGTRYSGFQVQQHADTIQSELERALQVFFRKGCALTGSSRTDAGVHATQNFFHVDWEEVFPQQAVYNLNALLPADIAIRSVREVAAGAHCRFDAVARRYRYHLHTRKEPFLEDRSWLYPYRLDQSLLEAAAALVPTHTDFTSFSKRNTQVKTFNCQVTTSRWLQGPQGTWIYEIEANRFLRGMVRGLVGSMLRLARHTMDWEAFEQLLRNPLQASADFSAPPQGLFLEEVQYPSALFK